MHKSLLKGKVFWTTKVPYKCPWSFKKILNLRQLASEYIRYYVGRDSNFFIWHDPWVGNSPLITQYRLDIVSIAESQSSAKLRDFLHDNSRDLPRSNHVDMMDLRRKIGSILIHHQDSISWDGLQAFKVQHSSIWCSIRDRGPPSPWYGIVWNQCALPKCSFTLWLALKNRLLTKDRMLAFGMNVDPVCLLCNTDNESVQHLFSNCPFLT